MKQFIIALILFGTITFVWTHEGGDNIKYRLLMGFKSGEYTQVLYDGPNKTCTVEVPNGFKLYFAATAYSSTEESPYSNEVTNMFTIIPKLEN